MIKIFQILFIGLLMSSCSVLSNIGGEEQTEEELSAEAKAEEIFQRKFFEAQKEKSWGNNDKAYLAFQTCIELNDQVGAVYYEMAKIEMLRNNDNSASELLDQALKLEPENRWYHLEKAQTQYNIGEYKNAAAYYKKALEIFPEDYGTYRLQAKCYEYAGQAQEAINVYDKYESMTAVTEEISLKKYDLYLSMGKGDQAEKEIEKLINSDPKEVRYYGILAELYTSLGRKEEAIALYERMREIDPDNGTLHWQLAQHYRAIGEEEKAFEEMKLAFVSDEISTQNKNTVLAEYFRNSKKNSVNLDKTLSLAKILDDSGMADSFSNILYAKTLLLVGKIGLANEKLRLSAQERNSDIDTWRLLLLTDYLLSDYKMLKDDSDDVLELYPLQPEFFLYSGFAKFKLDKINQSIITFKTGLSYVVDDESFNAVFKQLLSKAYWIEGSKDKYVLNYESSIASAGTATYSDQDEEDLDRKFGRTMSSMDKHYLAILWYEGLMIEDENNALLIEALGDVLFEIDDQKGALLKWKLAQSKGNNSEELKTKINSLE